MHGKLYKVGSTMSNNNDLPWLGGGGGEVVMVLAHRLVTQSWPRVLLTLMI